MRLWDRRGAGLVVVAIAIALYAPTLVFGRVDLDDLWLWADDSPLRAPTAATLHDVFFELDAHARRPFGTEYLPVRDVSVAIDMAEWGDNDRGPHATQLVLFALTVFGLGTLLVRFGLPRPVAWVGTLLWAVHPLHVESVAWLSERKGVLAGLFVIACGHAWLRYRGGGSRWWLVAAAAAAVAGVWSKAPAMFGPAVLAAWDVLLLPAARRRKVAIATVGLATALAAIPVVLIASSARVVGDSQQIVGGRLTAAVGAQGHYVESLVLARAPSVAYPIQTDGPGALELAGGAVAIAGSIALIVWARRRTTLALLAWAWIWFLPIGQLLVRVHILVADRFVYLWSVAACVAVAWLLERLRPVPRLAATAALATVLAIATIRAEGAWTSSVELFGRACAANPRDVVMCESLATALDADGRSAEALALLHRELAAQPAEPHLLMREARILDQLGRHVEALVAAKQAADTDTSSAMWFYATLLDQAGRPAEALPWVHRAAHNHPELAAYRRSEAMLLLELGRDGEAADALTAALAVEPGTPRDHLTLAKILVRLGRVGDASAQLDAAAREPALAGEIAAVRRSIAR